jgi:hypothetical protein
MHCPDHLLPLLYLQAFNQDVGIRMRRLRGLEYADAATQAQGTATRTHPLWAIVLLPFYFDSLPFMQRVWPASFRCDSRQLRSFNLGLFFCLSVSLSCFPTVQSFVLVLLYPTISPVTRFLSTFTVSSYSELYQYNLIDNDILAFLYPNNGFNRGEYLRDMIVSLHYHVFISPRRDDESDKEKSHSMSNTDLFKVTSTQVLTPTTTTSRTSKAIRHISIPQCSRGTTRTWTRIR